MKIGTERLDQLIEAMKPGNTAQYSYDEMYLALTELKRLREGDFTEDEIHNFCHNLKGVTARQFADGCASYQEKLYGHAVDRREVDQARQERDAAQRRYLNELAESGKRGRKITDLETQLFRLQLDHDKATTKLRELSLVQIELINTKERLKDLKAELRKTQNELHAALESREVDRARLEEYHALVGENNANALTAMELRYLSNYLDPNDIFAVSKAGVLKKLGAPDPTPKQDGQNEVKVAERDFEEQMWAMILVLLSQVDYTSGACSPTQSVGGTLPPRLLQRARDLVNDFKKARGK